MRESNYFINKYLIIFKILNIILISPTSSLDLDRALINKCASQKEGILNFEITSDLFLRNDTLPLTFTFSNKSHGFKCPTGVTPYKAFVYNDDDPQNEQMAPPSGDSNWGDDDPESEISFLQSGELVHFYNKVLTYYTIDEYCVSIDDTKMHVEFCLSTCDPKFLIDASKNISRQNVEATPKDVCIPKCCHLDQLYQLRPGHATPQCKFVADKQNRWSPTFYDSTSLDNVCVSKFENEAPNHKLRYRIQYLTLNTTFHISNMKYGTTRDTQKRSSFRLMEDGRLMIRNNLKNPITLSPKWLEENYKFCIEGVGSTNNLNLAPTHQLVLISNMKSKHLAPIISTSPDLEVQAYVYAAASFLSLVPLALTLLVYLLTWSTMNIHIWAIFSHISALFFLHIFIGTTHYMTTMEGIKGTGSCRVIGILAHFFFLATFFWLAIVNVDICLTLRSINSPKGTNKLRFMLYNLIAWGSPFIVIIVGALLDQQYGRQGTEDIDCDVLTPNYGQSVCFTSEESSGIYSYYIVGSLTLFSVIFAGLTFKRLYLQKQANEGLRSSASHQTISVRLFLKLFTVMGVSLFTEIIGWGYRAAEISLSMGQSRSWLIVIIDCLNWTIRAFAIFIIFPCKDKNWQDLKQQFMSFRRYLASLGKSEQGQKSWDEGVKEKYSMSTATTRDTESHTDHGTFEISHQSN